MYYPAEISNFKVKVKYLGRSTKRFTFNEVYEGIYVYGVERGYKAASLDYLVLPDGYRLLPWEQKCYFKQIDPVSIVLKIIYGRNSFWTNLVYKDNPFLMTIL